MKSVMFRARSVEVTSEGCGRILWMYYENGIGYNIMRKFIINHYKNYIILQIPPAKRPKQTIIPRNNDPVEAIFNAPFEDDDEPMTAKRDQVHNFL